VPIGMLTQTMVKMAKDDPRAIGKIDKDLGHASDVGALR
jgi:hypothetical protein